MTSAGGAGAMAAALGPRAGAGAEAEAEARRRLLRSVTRLQACARGFLLRRRLRSVREEFEAVVLEIEGDLRQLRWSGRVLQRPRFGPEDGASAVPAGCGAAGARPAQPSPGKPLDPDEAAENKTIPRKTQEKPNPRGAERAGSCGSIPPSAPLPRGTTPNPKKPQNPPDLGHGAAESEEEEELGASPEIPEDLGCGAAQSPKEEAEEEELGASPGIPEELQGLPRGELESLRNHLLLELLWVQQAVASRKQFLQLKQKLGVPSPPCTAQQP